MPLSSLYKCKVTFALALILLINSQVSAQSQLKIWYIDYPPYYSKSCEEPTGLLISVVDEIMTKTGIKVDYACYPSKRILDAIRHGEAVASIGWFKTKERESYAKFSLPIYENEAVGVYALNEVAEELKRFSSLESIMKSKRFKLGLIAGHSEGRYIDGLVRNYSDQTTKVNGVQVQLLKMLKEHRFDYILLPPEEIEVLAKEADVDPESFTLLKMDDIPVGNKRYIIYSKSIPQELIDQIDEVIRQNDI